MNIDMAIKVCALAHAGQFRHDGVTPYKIHSLMVASQFGTRERIIVSFLHDVVEDSDITLTDLYSLYGFSVRVIEAVDAITKRKDEKYRDYLQRVIANPIARDVKIEDIKHNLCCMTVDSRYNVNRKKYIKALELLEGSDE